MLRRGVWFGLAMLVIGGGAAHREADDFRPGLIGAYSPAGADGPALRVDADVLFDWQDGQPDLRVTGERFSATWKGLLFVRTEGAHRFHLHLTGRGSVVVRGKTLFEKVEGEQEWVDSEPIDLPYGHWPIEIRYEKTGAAARIGVYWSSEAFEIEPITGRYFFHQASKQDGGEKGAHLFDRGRQIVEAYRCFACHEGAGEMVGMPAPALTALKGNVHRDWLILHIQDPPVDRPDAKMPRFGVTADQASAMADFLIPAGKASDKSVSGDAKQGKVIFESAGCLACHRVGELGTGGLYSGPELTRVGEKRSVDAFYRLLTKPETINADHRMPVFALTKKQANDLAVYLGSLRGEERKEIPSAAKGDAKTGRELIGQFQCVACHAVSGMNGDLDKARVSAIAGKWETGCLSPLGEGARNHRPFFELKAEDRAALKAFFEQLPDEGGALALAELGRMAMGRKNCLACHRRENGEGLLEVVGQLAEVEEGMAPEELPALVPPSLNTVGDKLTDEELSAAVSGGRASQRPWLRVQMPKFTHDEKEKTAILDYLVSHDRVPARQKPVVDLPSSDQVQMAGHTLVGPNGFGCMTCHIVGDHQPSGIAAGALGTDLRHMGKRIRHSWYRRWLGNPARITPGTEMPTVDTAVPKLLNGKLEAQIEALWSALNAESFSVPTGAGVQLLSAKDGDSPIILRDCFEHDEQSESRTVRGLAIGFGNRQNVLYDLDSMTLVRWWVGDFARQETRGKTWFWQTAGIDLLRREPKVPSFALEIGDRILTPKSIRGTAARLDHFETRGNRVTFAVDLEFEGGTSIQVTEILTSLASSGVTRILWARGVPHRSKLFCVASGTEPGLTLGGPYLLEAQTAVGPVEINLPAGQKWARLEKPPFAPDEAQVFLAEFAENPRMQELRTCRLYYLGPEAPPMSGAIQSFSSEGEKKVLDVIPGYMVTRLPLSDEVMPTAMAWRGDGTLVAASLKGRIYLAKDTDGDGFEDQWSAYSHHLASPFGMLADGNDILVAHKPELLRLIDREGDDFAERGEVVASGWGYSFDYHDWTIGPVRDAKGDLYVNTGVQQDDRPAAAAELRGRTLKITPDGELIEWARGHRFAMGIAIDGAGHIFTSDNQGMQNPYNEINHVRQGHFFGFPNKLDPDRNHLPLETAAAIKAPHPWSRSVNGLVFIPEGDAFGPFGGHLLGAEMDTRRIVRFSFQKVGDTFQGATYPFSLIVRDEAKENFLGPVSVAFSPKGDLYVGSLLDSGWGGGNNRGEVCRVEYVGPVPAGIREVRAHRQGFTVDLTQPVEAAKASDPKSYKLTAATRTFRGSYASPDQDVTSITVSDVRLSESGRTVSFIANPMKEGFLYEIHVANLTADGSTFFPAEAYYTLNWIPDEERMK
jgi:mono/diheme cytochrome c family protein/glucose/arabinose dehydrogenase